MDNEFNNFCNQDDTYDDADLVWRVVLLVTIIKEITAGLEAESTKTANTTSSQASHKEELATECW